MTTRNFNLLLIAILTLSIIACGKNDDNADPQQNQTSNDAPCNGGIADIDLDGESIEINCLGGVIDTDTIFAISVQEGDFQMDGYKALAISISNYEGKGTYESWAKVYATDSINVFSLPHFSSVGLIQHIDSIPYFWLGEAMNNESGTVTVESDVNGKIKGKFNVPVKKPASSEVVNMNGNFEVEKL